MHRRIVCTRCGCLCDDIDVEIVQNKFRKVENACRRGAAFLRASDDRQRRARCSVAGAETGPESAIDNAGQLLAKARRPLVFGLDNSTLAAQAAGIELARSLKAVIDDTSSFCHGSVVRRIFEAQLPTCSLADVRDQADLLVYWGSNPHHAHPRHLSNLAYYPRERYRQTGWIPDARLVCIETRETETTSIADSVIKVAPGDDGLFIRGVIDSAQGTSSAREANAFVEMVRKSRLCVIFVGLGLIYALDGHLQPFVDMVAKLQEYTRMAVIPLVGHFNMRGFNRSLYYDGQTGFVNKVSFAAGAAHGKRFSFLEQLRTQAPDCVLIIGSNPFASLPRSLMSNLRGIPVICLDPFTTLTTQSADVVVGTAISGIEVEGDAVRMDGEEVHLPPAKTADSPSDEAVLQELLQRIRS